MRTKKRELDKNYPSGSYLNIGVLPCTNKEEAMVLETAIAEWIRVQNRRKWPFCASWFRNEAFVRGNQISRFRYKPGISTNEDGEFVITPVSGMYKKYEAFISREIDNKCGEAHGVLQSTLTKTNPEPRVVPNSQRREDKVSAQLAEIVFKVVWERPLYLPEKLREVASLIINQGTAALEIEYRETDVPITIPKFKIEEFEDPMMEEIFGKGEKGIREVPDGFEVAYKKELCADVWSPFHVVVDPAANASSGSITWIARRSFRDVGSLKEELLRKVEEGYEDEEFYHRENIESGINTLAGIETDPLYWWEELKDLLDSPESLDNYTGLVQSGRRDYSVNDTIHTVLDVKPNNHFPKGRTFILAGDKLLYAGPARAWSDNYPERWHPYTFFRFTTVANRFWGEAPMADIVPLQKLINRCDSLMKINQMFMAFGIWKIPKTSITDGKDSQTHGPPGFTFEYLPVGNGVGPERVKNEPLPNEILLQRQMCEASISRLSLMSRLLEGQNVSHLRSGTILDIAQKERLESRIPTLMSFQESVQHASQNVLIEVSLNLEEEDPELTARIKAAAADFSSTAINRFTGADIRDNVNISIDIISGLLNTPEAKAQKALDFYTAAQGNVSAQEKKQIFEDMGMGHYNTPDSTHVLRAEAMISNILGGSPDRAVPDPFIDTNPGIMAEIFLDVLREDKFYEYPPEAQTKLREIAKIYSDLNQEAIKAQIDTQLQLAKMGLE